MLLLLDECVPSPFGREVVGHEVHHIATLGWKGTRNGRLLERMRERDFAGLVTVDKSLALQQDIPNSGLFLVLMRVKRNRLDYLIPLVPELLRKLPFALPGQVIIVGA